MISRFPASLAGQVTAREARAVSPFLVEENGLSSLPRKVEKGINF
jgi:hypothetical protein